MRDEAYLDGETTGAVDALAVVDVRLDDVLRVVKEVHDRRHADALQLETGRLDGRVD